MISVQSLLAAIGLALVLNYLVKLVWEVIKEFIPLGSSLNKYGQHQSHWAVVTGGTDGIGLGFCEVLAGLGWNLCIVSRNETKIGTAIDRIK